MITPENPVRQVETMPQNPEGFIALNDIRDVFVFIGAQALQQLGKAGYAELRAAEADKVDVNDRWSNVLDNIDSSAWAGFAQEQSNLIAQQQFMMELYQREQLAKSADADDEDDDNTSDHTSSYLKLLPSTPKKSRTVIQAQSRKAA